MNNKALNHLIFSLTAAVAGIVLTTLSMTLIKENRGNLWLALLFMSACADTLIAIHFYKAIKEIFRKQATKAVFIAGLAALILMPLWAAFRLYLFQGDFSVTSAVSTMYLSFFANLSRKIVDQTVTYFSVTLFAQADVLGYFTRYVLILLTDFTALIMIPLLPFILVINDLIKGDDVYQFTNPKDDQDEPKL